MPEIIIFNRTLHICWAMGISCHYAYISNLPEKTNKQIIMICGSKSGAADPPDMKGLFIPGTHPE